MRSRADKSRGHVGIMHRSAQTLGYLQHIVKEFALGMSHDEEEC